MAETEPQATSPAGEPAAEPGPGLPLVDQLEIEPVPGFRVVFSPDNVQLILELPDGRVVVGLLASPPGGPQQDDDTVVREWLTHARDTRLLAGAAHRAECLQCAVGTEVYRRIREGRVNGGLAIDRLATIIAELIAAQPSETDRAASLRVLTL